MVAENFVIPESSQTSGLAVQEKNPMPVLPTNHEYSLLWLRVFHPKVMQYKVMQYYNTMYKRKQSYKSIQHN